MLIHTYMHIYTHQHSIHMDTTGAYTPTHLHTYTQTHTFLTCAGALLPTLLAFAPFRTFRTFTVIQDRADLFSSVCVLSY